MNTLLRYLARKQYPQNDSKPHTPGGSRWQKFHFQYWIAETELHYMFTEQVVSRNVIVHVDEKSLLLAAVAAPREATAACAGEVCGLTCRLLC